MVHDKIMGVLLSLQEKATGPIQRVYEICLESMQKVEGEIKSVAELPEIPFTVPIKRKILAAMEPFDPFDHLFMTTWGHLAEQC